MRRRVLVTALAFFLAFPIVAEPPNPIPSTTTQLSRGSGLVTSAAIITAPDLAMPGQTGLSAAVPDAGSGATYAWSVTNGTITSAPNNPSIVFTAGTAAFAVLSVTVTTPADGATSASFTVRIVPALLGPLAFTTVAGETAGNEDGPFDQARFALGCSPGLATDAQLKLYHTDPFGYPPGLAVDASGNVFVADPSNNRIRKISPAGEVATFAGEGQIAYLDGAASVAGFNFPLGVALDDSGNLYVADSQHFRIRKIAPDGTVSAFSGMGWPGYRDGAAGIAMFELPDLIARDSAGNLYVAEAEKNRIRKIAPDGSVSTLAGSGTYGFLDGPGATAQFAYPYGIAVDGSGYVFVADQGNHKIRRVAPDGTVETWAGTTQGYQDGAWNVAKFASPRSVAVDGSGAVFVADEWNNVIRKIAADRTVSTYAGTGNWGYLDGAGTTVAQFRNPGGIALDGAGVLYVAEPQNGRIRKVATDASRTVSTLAGSGPAPWQGDSNGTGPAAKFRVPGGLAIDAAGNALLADQRGHVIRKITPLGVVTTLTGSGEPGYLDGLPGVAQFFQPKDLVFDSAGNLYVSDSGNHRIRKVAPDGSVSTVAGTGVAGFADGPGLATARFDNPEGLARDGYGNIFVADSNNHSVRKIDPANTVSTVAGTGSAGCTNGPASSAMFFYPHGVAVDKSGNVLIADGWCNQIRKLSGGTVSTLAGGAYFAGHQDGPGATASFRNPVSLTLDGAGNIYVAEWNERIRKVEPDGTVSSIGGDGIPGGNDGLGVHAHFRTPRSFAIAQDGSLWVADQGNAAIRVGRTATLTDAATIDSASGHAGQQRRLGTTGPVATSWFWQVVQRPFGTTAALSSTTSRTPAFTPDAPGKYVFRVTAAGAGGAQSITQVSLFAYPPPTATVSGGGTICLGMVQAELTGMAPWSLTWSDGLVQSEITLSPVVRSVSPGVTTTYSVTAFSDANGMGTSSGSATVTVTGFLLTQVTPGEVGTQGPATLTLQGCALASDATAELVSPSGTRIAGTGYAFVGTTSVNATFDLTGRETGLYDVVASRPSMSSSTLVDALNVVGGTPPRLTVKLTTPANVLRGHLYTAWLEYANEGTSDLPAELLVVSSPQNVYMRLSPSETWHTGSVQLLAINMREPIESLPPGARFRIPIQFWVPMIWIDTFDFKTQKMLKDGSPVDWAAIETAVRPAGIADDAWSAVWSNFRTQMGSTAAEYVTRVLADARYLASVYREAPGAVNPLASGPTLLPSKIYSVNALLAFEISKASGQLGPSAILATAVDASFSEPGISLSFDRLAFSSIEQRFRVGPFGRGWSHLYEVTATGNPADRIKIHQPGGRVRSFVWAHENLVASSSLDSGKLTWTGSGCQLREPDGTVKVFGTDGRLTWLEDPNGNRLTLGWDAQGLRTITHSNGDALAITYNSQGFVASVTDPAGRATLYGYDPAGHLTSVEEPGGRITSYSYVGAPGSPSDHALSAVSLPDGTHTYFSYDTRGRISATRRDGNATRVTYAYDDDDRMTVTDALGKAAVFQLGPFGQVMRVVDPLDRAARFEFDPEGNATRAIDPADNTTMLGYNSRGNALTARDPLGNATDLSYTPDISRLAALKDGRGKMTRFSYDTHGNATTSTYEDGSAEHLAYDTAGNVTSFTNRRGQLFTMQYDTKGRLTRKVLPDASAIDYTYDGRGNLTSATDPLGTVAMQYDTRDFLTRIDYPDGHWLTFEYDAGGKRTRRTDDGGFVLTYEYDAAGRLNHLKSGAGMEIVGYGYDLAGRLVQEAKGNGTVTTYEYDAAGQLVHLLNLGPGGAVQSRFDYIYDNLGNRTSMTTLAGTTSYGYDVAGRLTSVIYPDARHVSYEYDAVGNRVGVVDNGVRTDYTVNDLNQYNTVGTATFTYDADGNMLTRTDSTGTTTYEYDAMNRLVRVGTPAQGTWRYTYDALGSRVVVDHDGQVTRYKHDPNGEVVSKCDGTGAVVARYVAGKGLVSQVDASGTASFYGFDALGTTRQLTDGTGAVVRSYDYDAWGSEVGSTGTDANPFSYCGRFGVMVDAPGLAFMKNRQYASGLGRFVQADPIGVAGGINPYTYVSNAPTMFVDPLGLFLADIFFRGVLDLGRGIIGIGVSGGTAAFTGGILTPFSVLKFGESLYNVGKGIVGMIRGVFGSPSMPMPVASAQDGSASGEPQKEDGKKSANPLYDVSIKGRLVFLDDEEEPWPAGAQPQEPACDGYGCESRSDEVQPLDPNEMSGPTGFVKRGQRLTYTIYFENKATATAPAQEVIVTDNLDPALDLSTFELGEINFGDQVVASLGGKTAGADSVMHGDLRVDVEARLAGGRIDWVLRSIDPMTGTLPEDALAGFLPPENGTGRGQGHVSFSVKVRQDATIGTGIQNAASIIFDVNDAIVTNSWWNTIGRPGDANSDGNLNVTDVFYLVNNLFAGGPAPSTMGDANGDGAVDVTDVFFLINYLFGGGPTPAVKTGGNARTASVGARSSAEVRALVADGISVGTVWTSGTGSVRVPVFLKDNAGTPLGGDRAGSNRISQISFRVDYGPRDCVTTSTPFFDSAAAGSAFARVSPDFVAKPWMAGRSQGFVASVSGTGGAGIPVSTATPGPGDKIGELVFSLNGCQGDIALHLEPALASLGSSSGTVENVANGGLILTDGVIHTTQRFELDSGGIKHQPPHRRPRPADRD